MAATVSLRSTEHAARDAYFFVVSVYTYLLYMIVYTWIALGMLYLRFSPGNVWHSISPANHWVSITAALVLLTSTVFPLLCMWIPDSGKKTLGQSESIPWYISQTVGVVVFAFSILYWAVFRYIVPHIGSHGGRTFVAERTPIFHKEHDPKTGDYYLVQVFETIKTYWGHSNPSAVDQTLMDRELARQNGHSAVDLKLVERELASPVEWEIR